MQIITSLHWQPPLISWLLNGTIINLVQSTINSLKCTLDNYYIMTCKLWGLKQCVHIHFSNKYLKNKQHKQTKFIKKQSKTFLWLIILAHEIINAFFWITCTSINKFQSKIGVFVVDKISTDFFYSFPRTIWTIFL